ncbi:uncharacterized protein LOC122386931 [Amphibalanus amphitrite]|uniref:uncharacterized protein LOC122386931 n=1 Tax=Amphibalanus amphitrite TaxID=1232801 RepID=UPI001C90330D|nr:uncharacterized protein LOC122386931 [Amphibalanus amphitrite]
MRSCILLALVSWAALTAAQTDSCSDEDTNFELVTGYVYSAPSDMLDSRAGTLMLAECIDMCRQNASCQAFNYETGLCVLIDSNADANEDEPEALTVSQFPVFTMYVQKMCYAGAPKCSSAWAFERVQNFTLAGVEKKSVTATSRLDCQKACLSETEFVCRSAAFTAADGTCSLSDMDRHTTAGMGVFRAAEGTDYLENNCIEEPVKLCEFQKIDGRILKTVDSVHQEVESIDACRELCLSASFRCHTYDYNDTGDQVCRLSHHAASTLTHIQEPYLEIPGSTSYELSSCYNVTIDCRAGNMVARIQTSKMFNGKIYAKGNPNTCVTDVDGSLQFELSMSYTDLECGVKRVSAGQYQNDVVLQHHDRIVTSADLGLSVHCRYDLSNKTVSNDVNLEVKGDIQPVLEEEAVVDSPNVLMSITDPNGSELQAASVGDPLSLRFQIMDPMSPYEIFVRDLVAMDGSNSNEILLIDANGCPTDESILQALLRVNGTKDLASAFDAFKFPTSDVVQFRAMVTPCLPRCEPAICETRDYAGTLGKTESYGRRRRSLDRVRRDASEEELLVVQTIRIDDKYAARRRTAAEERPSLDGPRVEAAADGFCVNTMGLVVGSALFLLAQLAIIAAWMYGCQRRRRSKLEETYQDNTASSLAQLYDTGYSAHRA